MKFALPFAAGALAVGSLAVAPLAGAVPASASAPGAPVPLAIVVYDQPSFKGRAMTIDRAVPDLAALNFNDKVASFAIQGAGDWMLCENRNYAGRCVRAQWKADDLKLLQIAGRVSSLYPVPATPAANP